MLYWKNIISNEDGDEITLADLIEDEFNLESSIINKDYVNQHNQLLTETELFIQQKYYQDELSVKKYN